MIVVGIAARRPVVALGLAAAVTAEPTWRVGCSAATVDEFVGRIESNTCSIVLCDATGLEDQLPAFARRHFAVVALAETPVAGVAASVSPDASPAVIRAALIDAHTSRPGADSFCTSRLSSRELEVLVLIGGGLANKQVATHLGISMSTVKRHIEHLMDKSGRHTRAALAALATEVGRVRPETLSILDRASVAADQR